jgi:hypothetical protein
MYLTSQTRALRVGCQSILGRKLGRDFPPSSIVLLSFGATFFLPFPTIFERHRKKNFPFPSAKFKIPKNKRCFPLSFRELSFTIRLGKKRST